mmetsp:Transcript_11992/g.33181  ORF Transcript_11992/g.33181 Transcript_11992/m.33181 type:complete len:429 (-) Transcript_11992:55-1341(-)
MHGLRGPAQVRRRGRVGENRYLRGRDFELTGPPFIFFFCVCVWCRQMGVHISQVKSCELDHWTQEQLFVYECSGGNKRARDFFAKHASQSVSGAGVGGSTAAALQEKYTCRAAEQYKKALAKEVQRKLAAPSSNGEGADETSTSHAPAEAAPAAAKPKPKTALGAARTSGARRPTSARRPAKGGLGATRKKGGLGGLGAKKITSKVDDNLFTQAPEEAPKVVVEEPVKLVNKSPEAPVVETVSQATSSSRFAHQEEEAEEEAPKVDLRGSDGHISLSKLMANKPAGGGTGGRKPARSTRGIGMGMGMKKQQNKMMGAGSSMASSDEAQKRFSGAKSISSQQYHGTSKEDEMEKQQRLSKFHGATAISSADYYGHGSGGSSPRSDMGAEELIGKLSMQAKMDVENLKGLASKAKSKIFDFARDMQNRYG